MKAVRHAIGALLVALLCAALPTAARAQDPWFAKDKAAHFGATAGISFGTYAGSALVTDSERRRVASGLGGGLGAAAAKELWDRSHSGTPSWRDFAWGAVGTAVGTTVAWLIDRARRPRSPATAAGSSSAGSLGVRFEVNGRSGQPGGVPQRPHTVAPSGCATTSSTSAPSSVALR